jgi:hypothetical protein
MVDFDKINVGDIFVDNDGNEMILNSKIMDENGQLIGVSYSPI